MVNIRLETKCLKKAQPRWPLWSLRMWLFLNKLQLGGHGQNMAKLSVTGLLFSFTGKLETQSCRIHYNNGRVMLSTDKYLRNPGRDMCNIFFIPLIFMPPTSKKLRGHIGLGLSVCPSVRLTVCPSVRLSVRPSVRYAFCWL